MTRLNFRSGAALVLVGLLGLASSCGTSASVQKPPPVVKRVVAKPPVESATPPPPPLPAALRPPSPATVAATSKLPTVAQLKGAWARVYLLSNPGPFQYVAYEVTSRGGAGVVSHLRGMMGRRDAIIRTELISRDRLATLMGALRDLGAADLPEPPPLPGAEASKKAREARKGTLPEVNESGLRPRADIPHQSEVPIYELSYRLGDKEKTVMIASPTLHPDPRFGRFITEVRRFVIASVGDIGYHGPTGPPSRRGFLFIDSVPGASVTVDGVALPDPTPVFAYAVSAGKHVVVLENKEHGLKQTYKVTVKPGMTTSVEVDLR